MVSADGQEESSDYMLEEDERAYSKITCYGERIEDLDKWLAERKQGRYEGCQQAHILTTDVNGQAKDREIARRLSLHRRGMLGYEYMKTEKLLSIASARLMTIEVETVDDSSVRNRLIDLIRASHDAAGPFKILELPPEIREWIYKLVVLPEDGTIESIDARLPRVPNSLRVNKQIQREVGDIFFAEVKMVLPCEIQATKGSDGTLENVRLEFPSDTRKWIDLIGVEWLSRIPACLLVDFYSNTRQFKVYRISAVKEIR